MKKKRKIIIINARALIEDKLVKTDILIENGVFKKFGKNLKSPEKDTEFIYAKGRIALPGIIDAHTHFSLQQGKYKTADNFSSGSLSALYGGVTFFIDYSLQVKGNSLKESVKQRAAEAENNSYIDYSFHAGITDWNLKTEKEALDLLRSGFPSFKMFLIYRDKGWLSDDSQVFDALSKLGQKGGIVEVHCENNDLINLLTGKLVKEKKTQVKFHPISRPDFTEAEAINRMIFLNKYANGKLYIVHVSSLLSAEIIRESKQRGIQVFAETCPQYLSINSDVFNGKDAELFATCPPVRRKEDKEGMWEMIKQGVFDTIATDHCSFNSEQKKLGRNDFRNLPFGMPGTEFSFPVIYTEGHVKRKIGIEKISKLMSENPAKIFGLTRRGKIAPGYIADLFLFNPDEKAILSKRTQNHPVDYCPYEGKEVFGIPETVVANGEVKILMRRLVGEKNGVLTKRFADKN
ncbi:MAG: dihydropyrimidinase [bacterium]|nr:dihydropyrimidinase [bacterium]